jgi:aspartate/methionine/tyrosine aminotransferase
MRYTEFSQLRQTLLANTTPPPRRMDEFDLYTAMAAWKPPQANQKTTTETLLNQWQGHSGINPAFLKNSLTGQGIKAFLRGLFPILKAQGLDVWLPEDVYAGYRLIAEESDLEWQGFTTLPQGKKPALEGLQFLKKTGPKAAVVLVNPAIPLGRFLTTAEVKKLTHWLSQSPQRLLILDAVYDPGTPLDSKTQALMETGQCVLLHSLSKTWITPNAFGVAVVPPGIQTPLKERLSALEAPPSLPQASACLGQHPTRPQSLEALYKAAWKALTQTLEQIHPSWRPPDCGYISWLPMGFERILDRFNVLAAPASIFGSRAKDRAVISCLNEVLKEPHSPSEPAQEA